MRTAPAQRGFTLIEIIVSLGVFSVVITIAVGALLMLVAANAQLQSEQVVMTNLSFALDSMTREIRTGTNYYCVSAANYNANGINRVFSGGQNLDAILGESTNDCPQGKEQSQWHLHGMAFEEGGNSITGGSSNRILYFHSMTPRDDGMGEGKLYRRVGSGQPVSILASDIYVHRAEFIVTGSSPLSTSDAQDDQAAVTIFIEASRDGDAAGKRYYLQTTVTQRTLDI